VPTIAATRSGERRRAAQERRRCATGPLYDLVADWAYMVCAALASNLKSWLSTVQHRKSDRRESSPWSFGGSHVRRDRDVRGLDGTDCGYVLHDGPPYQVSCQDSQVLPPGGPRWGTVTSLQQGWDNLLLATIRG
jgi:hypothetical protein